MTGGENLVKNITPNDTLNPCTDIQFCIMHCRKIVKHNPNWQILCDIQENANKTKGFLPVVFLLRLHIFFFILGTCMFWSIVCFCFSEMLYFSPLTSTKLNSFVSSLAILFPSTIIVYLGFFFPFTANCEITWSCTSVWSRQKYVHL